MNKLIIPIYKLRLSDSSIVRYACEGCSFLSRVCDSTILLSLESFAFSHHLQALSVFSNLL